NVRIEGLPAGTELQARAFELPDDGGEVERGPIAEYVASNGATFINYTLAAASVSAGHRVRFEVVHYGTTTARLVSGTAQPRAYRRLRRPPWRHAHPLRARGRVGGRRAPGAVRGRPSRHHDRAARGRKRESARLAPLIPRRRGKASAFAFPDTSRAVVVP